MAYSSSSSPPCASKANERSRREVLLHDWWLIKVEDECSRARLGVGGIATTGKTEHIFKSAPIVKSYGGFILETADGITVRIHGLINASRMHQNGFPSEACDHFQIGFPYCWRDYADRYLQTDTKGNGVPTCASDIHDCFMDSANTASRCSPVCSKEFPVGRLVECLKSICKEIVDGAQRSTDSAQNLCKNNDYKENMNVVTQADGNTVESDGDSNVAEENAYMAADNNAQDGLKQVSNDDAQDSISSKKHDVGSSQEELLKNLGRCDSHSQKKLTNGRNENQTVVDTGNNQVLSFSDGYGVLNSENSIKHTLDLMEIRTEADAQNLDMRTGESNSLIDISFAECAHEICQLNEAYPDMLTWEQSISDIGISCLAEYANEDHQLDAHVNAQGIYLFPHWLTGANKSVMMWFVIL